MGRARPFQGRSRDPHLATYTSVASGITAFFDTVTHAEELDDWLDVSTSASGSPLTAETLGSALPASHRAIALVAPRHGERIVHHRDDEPASCARTARPQAVTAASCDASEAQADGCVVAARPVTSSKWRRMTTMRKGTGSSSFPVPGTSARSNSTPWVNEWTSTAGESESRK